MSGMAVPLSPKHGFRFDGQECDVRKCRKERRCEGGQRSRGGGEGPHAPDCTVTIRVGDIAVATLIEAYGGEVYACVPCALAVKAIRPVDAAPL